MAKNNRLTSSAKTIEVFVPPMPSNITYLSLGSNLGDRAANLRAAIAALAEANVCVTKISSFYETEPVDYLEQPWFLNRVVEAETSLAPMDLLRALRKIESELGSKKEFAKGPRLLDMDILLYNDLIVELPELQIPHPRMLQRNFVLAPLAEIAPGLKHPSWSGTAQQMFDCSSDQGKIRKL
jgi:2-amino-4-hydroxy-6-hydroxymethyldihydropteridine diphosphokinase